MLNNLKVSAFVVLSSLSLGACDEASQEELDTTSTTTPNATTEDDRTAEVVSNTLSLEMYSAMLPLAYYSTDEIEFAKNVSTDVMPIITDYIVSKTNSASSKPYSDVVALDLDTILTDPLFVALLESRTVKEGLSKIFISLREKIDANDANVDSFAMQQVKLVTKIMVNGVLNLLGGNVSVLPFLTDFSGEWCGKKAETAEECADNSLPYMQLTEATGKLCFGGADSENCQSFSDADVSYDTLSFTYSETQTALALDSTGEALTGIIVNDEVITLYRIGSGAGGVDCAEIEAARSCWVSSMSEVTACGGFTGTFNDDKTQCSADNKQVDFNELLTDVFDHDFAEGDFFVDYDVTKNDTSCLSYYSRQNGNGEVHYEIETNTALMVVDDRTSYASNINKWSENYSISCSDDKTYSWSSYALLKSSCEKGMSTSNFTRYNGSSFTSGFIGPGNNFIDILTGKNLPSFKCKMPEPPEEETTTESETDTQTAQ
jgi:hypothetical protein